MILVQYLLDANEEVTIPGVEAPPDAFGDVVDPVAPRARAGEDVTEQIAALVALAREEGELVGEQFLHWFLQEQREEVSSMSDLLAIVERGKDNLLLVEEYLAPAGWGRESARGGSSARRRRRALARPWMSWHRSSCLRLRGCTSLLEEAGNRLLAVRRMGRRLLCRLGHAAPRRRRCGGLA